MKNARAGLKELDPGAERIEDGGHLRSGGSAANDDHGGWHAVQIPGIAMRGRELGTRNPEAPAQATGAYDEFVGLKSQPARGFDGVLIGEARGASPLVDTDSRSVDLCPKSRMGLDIGDDLTHALEQVRII